MLWYNHMCLLIWTVFSGERCGPWASCLSFNIVILCLARECITMVQCVTYIYDFDLWPQYQFIFSPWIWVWQNVFALWHRHTKFWHMGISPWDNMLCTFLTLVWPWPLTYIRVAGVSLVSFTHSFYLVITVKEMKMTIERLKKSSFHICMFLHKDVWLREFFFEK